MSQMHNTDIYILETSEISRFSTPQQNTRVTNISKKKRSSKLLQLIKLSVIKTLSNTMPVIEKAKEYNIIKNIQMKQSVL